MEFVEVGEKIGVINQFGKENAKQLLPMNTILNKSSIEKDLTTSKRKESKSSKR